ncbi:Homeobox protein homothorax [Papilio machaon]|uniref:Homeobox protein homothorax n=1 Tax=Papilio machaon TaxID=76193 RepID=A0A194RLZ2_PAPMA|nr:Homeobox protein homothorax [Papilio machaon]
MIQEREVRRAGSPGRGAKGARAQRPPSSSLSYGGAATDDVRSPGSGGTPGPLGQPPPQTLDATDPDGASPTAPTAPPARRIYPASPPHGCRKGLTRRRELFKIQNFPIIQSDPPVLPGEGVAAIICEFNIN